MYGFFDLFNKGMREKFIFLWKNDGINHEHSRIIAYSASSTLTFCLGNSAQGDSVSNRVRVITGSDRIGGNYRIGPKIPLVCEFYVTFLEYLRTNKQTVKTCRQLSWGSMPCLLQFKIRYEGQTL